MKFPEPVVKVLDQWIGAEAIFGRIAAVVRFDYGGARPYEVTNHEYLQFVGNAPSGVGDRANVATPQVGDNDPVVLVSGNDGGVMSLGRAALPTVEE